MKDTTQKAFDNFSKDTVNHELTILKDDGLYRHMRFGEKGSSIYAINITTWPGYLAVTGDMGDYVFTRTPDMFEFFRGKDINTGYWGEKLVAEPRGSEYGKKWSADEFRSEVCRFIENNLDPLDDLEDEAEIILNKEIRIAIAMDIEHIEYKEEADEFISRFNKHDFQFDCFYEYDCTEYTHQYLWVCYAIVDVIKRYDEITKQQAA
ncbi:hypothetical protein ACPUEK_16065 [Marinomonas gallaica]|uniref:hypothetical protein n=1 Tax=Marinomonas gallaica TaxID=1806667 RepID=UPI003CE5299E